MGKVFWDIVIKHLKNKYGHFTLHVYVYVLCIMYIDIRENFKLCTYRVWKK